MSSSPEPPAAAGADRPDDDVGPLPADATDAAPDPAARPAGSTPAHLVFVDQFRAVAALYVALYHALLVIWPNGGPRPQWYLRWADFGHVSVSVFIVLSGYSLALGPARRGLTKIGSYWRFMEKRAKRLLPPYWIALTGAVLLLALAPKGATSAAGAAGEWTKGPLPGRSIIAFYLLIHDFWNVPSPNSPLWSIAVEWHLYFLFPVLLYLGCKYGMGKMVAGALVVGVALHYVVVHTGAATTTPHFLALFAFGIAAAYAVVRQPSQWNTASSTKIGIGLIALGCILFGILAKWEVGGDLVAGALVAVALWVLGSHPPAPPARKRSVGGFLVWVGLLSYSLYLVHSPAEKIMWKFLVSKLNLGKVPSLVILAGTGIGVALIGAWVLHVVVERPAQRWSQKVHTEAATPPGPVAGPAAGPRQTDGMTQARTSFVAGAVSVGAVAALYLLAVRTGVGQRIDSAPVLRHNWDRLNRADVKGADDLLKVVALGLVPVVAWAGRRRVVPTVLALAGALVCLRIAEWLQGSLSRPDLTSFNPLYHPSFPSGHTAGSMALALALVWLAPGEAWARWLAVGVSGVVAGIVLSFPIHRPSDVLAGDFIAFGVMVAMSVVARRQLSRAPARSSGGGRLVAGPVVSTGRVLAVTAVVLAGEALELRVSHLTLGQLGWSYPVAVLAMATAAELFVAAFVAI